MINYYVINAVTRKKVKESGCESKETAKLIRDEYNENGNSSKDKYCVTRSETNFKSKRCHTRPKSKGRLNVFSTEI